MPISAADVARLLETMGVDRVVCVDLHSAQIMGFFGNSVTVDNLNGGVMATEYLMKHKDIKSFDDFVVVSPDAGGVSRAKSF